MVKFLAVGAPGKLIGLGLTAENVERLKVGLPIMIDARVIDPALEFNIMLFYGETEGAIAYELAKHNLLRPETDVRIIVKPNSQHE